MVCCGNLHVLHYRAEYAHNVGEACDAQHQDQADDEALYFTLWVVVAQADRGESCEHEVDEDCSDLEAVELTQGVVIVKCVLIIVLSRPFSNQEPKAAHEVGQEEDDPDDAKDLEALREVNLLHDLVVVSF